MSDKIKCELCHAETHYIANHLKKDHEKVSVEEYSKRFPDAPLASKKAIEMLEERRKQDAAKAKMAEEAQATAETKTVEVKETTVEKIATGGVDKIVKKALHEVFELSTKNALGKGGKAIPISCIENPANAELVPELNDTYVWDIDVLKNVLMALELKINCYVWGHKGSGKSEQFEQIAARTGRPFVRVQHTANTEESHIVGMWTVKKGEMNFELGPLALAMKHGWIYLADEYDFAMPSVLSVYQAVLEGKPLMIKEADAENRIIKPHPNFRFVATGNTNGSGDDTGLYQGTNLQNSANFDRFGMVLKKEYMPKEAEVEILIKRVGVASVDAEKLVEFATSVRNAYDGSKISDTISPRSLIDATRIGMGRADYKVGLRCSFINKLTRTDAEVAEGLAQRIFG